MTVFFQVIVIIILITSFLGSVGEEKDLDLRRNMVSLCIASMAAFILSVVFL